MSFFLKSSILSAAAIISLTASVFTLAEERKIIELTQVPCQFIESENGIDHGYKTTKKSDCAKINAESGKERLTKSKTIVVEEGSYTFRVHNKGVPYALGFWIRGDGAINRLKLPSTSGGGLVDGASKDYEIDLVPGEYVYSCPLNPTVNHKLVVKSSEA